MEAEFILSAARPDQFPDTGLPEIAFLGRSNVGKSSLLNVLVGKKGLAFTSGRPGCTQMINFYRVGGEYCFVDVPGYGYAKAPKEIAHAWRRLVEHYLEARPATLFFLLLDARRGWMEADLELKKWLEFHKRRYLVIATKTDKLKSQKERHHGMAALEAQETEAPPLPFSAVTSRGVREIWQAISKNKNNRKRAAKESLPSQAPLN